MLTMTKYLRPTPPLSSSLQQQTTTPPSPFLYMKMSTKTPPISSTTAATASSQTTTTTTTSTAKVGQIMDRKLIQQQKQKQQQKQANPAKPPSSLKLFVKAGLPLILFSIGSAFVLKSALEGKAKERDASKGAISKSERQARMEAEKNDMMEKLNKQMKKDFDNTKRIERPEEILERRRMEREQRNRWYNRFGRWIMGNRDGAGAAGGGGSK